VRSDERGWLVKDDKRVYKVPSTASKRPKGGDSIAEAIALEEDDGVNFATVEGRLTDAYQLLYVRVGPGGGSQAWATDEYAASVATAISELPPALDSQLVREINDVNITVSDLRRLHKPETYLNDVAVNAYMALVSLRSNDNKSLRKARYLSSFFADKLQTVSASAEATMWRNPLGPDQDTQLVFIPIHVKRVHWALLIIDIPAGVATVYDPMGLRHAMSIATLAVNWIRHKLKMPRWSCEVKEAPACWGRQCDSFSCGLYVCVAACMVAMGATPLMEADMVPLSRRGMVAALLRGVLSPSA